MTFLLSLLLAATFASKADVPRVQPAELQALIDKGDAVAVDVRGTVPFEISHVAGAIWLPLGQLSQRAVELPDDKLIVAYCTCKSEETSLEAAMRLGELGFERVAVLQGGFAAWTAAGLPTESKRKVAASSAGGRLAPPEAVGCDRNELTSYTGKVTRYRRDGWKVTITIATTADTIERVTARRHLIEGQPFTAADWIRIERRKGVLRKDMSAIAWVCTGGETVVDWRPGTTFTGAE